MVKFFKRNCHNSTTTCNTFGNDFLGDWCEDTEKLSKIHWWRTLSSKGNSGRHEFASVIPLARTFREILVLGGVGLNK